MQSFDLADFDLKPLTVEVEVPREEADSHLRSYANSGSWEVALGRFGSEGPPSGDADDNVRLTKELAERHPLGRIFPTQILGPHGSVVAQAAGEDAHDRLDRAEHEAMRIRIWAPLGVEVLDTIKATFELPDRAGLTDFFATELIDREVAARIADGVARFLEGDDDGALHVLVPQLEAAIRGAAARAGVVVIKTPSGPAPGGVRGLRAILADLTGRLDESWRRYLANALADPLGVNLRNQVSHGLHGPTTRNDVAIAIQIACHLRLWRRGEDLPPEPGSDRSE